MGHRRAQRDPVVARRRRGRAEPGTGPPDGDSAGARSAARARGDSGARLRGLGRVAQIFGSASHTAATRLRAPKSCPSRREEGGARAPAPGQGGTRRTGPRLGAHDGLVWRDLGADPGATLQPDRRGGCPGACGTRLPGFVDLLPARGGIRGARPGPSEYPCRHLAKASLASTKRAAECPARRSSSVSRNAQAGLSWAGWWVNRPVGSVASTSSRRRARSCAIRSSRDSASPRKPRGSGQCMISTWVFT